jgi:hypothetical protein
MLEVSTGEFLLRLNKPENQEVLFGQRSIIAPTLTPEFLDCSGEKVLTKVLSKQESYLRESSPAVLDLLVDYLTHKCLMLPTNVAKA